MAFLLQVGAISGANQAQLIAANNKAKEQSSPTEVKKTAVPTVEKNNDLSEKQIDLLDKISKWIVAPINSLSAISGGFSFLLPNVFNKKSELVDKISDWSSFGAIWSTSGFSLLNRFWQKDTIGISAFTTDLVTSFLGDGEMRYQWKGWGSGQDHGPLILGELHTNKKIVEAYSLDTKDTDHAKKQFQNYKSFGDSAEKMLFGTKVVLEDIAEDFQKNGFLGGLKNSFLTGKRSAERNLLVSGIGILVGAFTGTILGLRKVGSTLRDVMGIHADIAYIYKGLSEVISGKKKLKDIEKHDKLYIEAGVEYTVGSTLDLIYRWTGIEGLNYAALGLDRFGAMKGAFGILEEAIYNQSKSNKKTKKEPSPEPITQPNPGLALAGG